MSEPYLTALIGAMAAIVAAILTGFLQPLWTNKIGKKAALRAEIRLHRSTLPRYLKQAIESHIWNYRLNERPNEETKRKLRTVKENEGLTEIFIKNPSKVSVEDVCIVFGTGNNVCYDLSIDGREQSTVFSQKVDIGTLLPGSTATVLVWSLTDNSDSYLSAIRKKIKVQAKSYDNIIISFPVQQKVMDEYKLIRWRIYNPVWWTFVIGVWVLFAFATSIKVTVNKEPGATALPSPPINSPQRETSPAPLKNVQ